jgi:plasmid stabilization system protein ParE
MKIIWTDFAIENLRAIFDYYLENANEKVAHKIRKRILNSTNQLKTNPESGPLN